MKYKNVFSALLIVLCVIILQGCSEPQQIEAEPQQPEQDKMLSYLMQENAVRSVEHWDEGFGEGYLITTANYDIYTTMQDALMLRQLPVFMEGVNVQYRRTAGIRGRTTNRYIIFVFETRQQWDSFGETLTGAMWPIYQKIEKGAYYAKGVCVAYNVGRKDTFAVLAHEGWHQFSHRHFTFRLPAWLDEGLAMQFEGFNRTASGYVFSPEYNYMRLNSLANVLDSGRTMSLRELLTLNPASLVDDASEEAAARIKEYYSRLYALVRFLDEYNNGIYRPNFLAIIRHGLEGRWELHSEVAQAARDRNTIFTTEINSRLGWSVFAGYYGTRLDDIEEQFDSFSYWLAMQHRTN